MPKIEGDLAQALRLLRDYFERTHIPFALVGALVPALLLSSETGGRETRDADHVIKLTSWEHWESVLAELTRLGFVPGRGEQEHRLHYGTAEIDLLPFGITNGPDDVLIWRKSGNRMTMTGFADVFHHAVLKEVSPGLTLPIVPLWLFAVLKVTAYLDRQFPRDLRDLIYVLERYELDDQSSRRFDLAGQVHALTYETAGAYLLGRDIRSTASPNAVVLVQHFVASITDEHHTVINTILREENSIASEARANTVYRLVESFRSGLA